VGTKNYDFYSYTVGNFLLTGKIWITNKCIKKGLCFMVVFIYPRSQFLKKLRTVTGISFLSVC
jgi:hypothetical protein